MFPSVLLAVAACASSVAGLTTPLLSKRFSIPGAANETGFSIPENVQPGVYEVFIDGEGVAHHVQIAEPTAHGKPLPAVHGPAADSGLVERQIGPRDITCGNGNDMNRGWTDEVVRDVVAQCGEGRRVAGWHHIYAIRGNVAAFYCNHNDLYQSCYGDRVRNIIVSDISGRCGSYKPGWSEDYRVNSVGYHEVGDDKWFCGDSH